jgi:hypothetical protein
MIIRVPDLVRLCGAAVFGYRAIMNSSTRSGLLTMRTSPAQPCGIRLMDPYSAHT